MNELMNVQRVSHSGKKPAIGAVGMLAAWCVLLCGLAAGSARAMAAMADDAAATAGSSAAARLSSVEGSVQLTQDGQVIADPATANLPVFEGAQITTGGDGRVEMQLEDGSLARLSPNSTVTLTTLQKQGTELRTEIVVNSGMAYFELQPNAPDHNFKLTYGTASLTPSSFTVVRVKMDAPPGELAVFSGNVHLDRGEEWQLDLHGGESLTFNGGGSDPYNLLESIAPDSWDSWNADRDQVLNADSASRTAATSGVGVNEDPGMSDLDVNGNWYMVPGQGYVWSPFMAQTAGWDPYGYGRWVYYPRYGYVWVSGYGWGYQPYQCGLWNYYDAFGWAWAPGAGGCNAWWGGGYEGGGWGYNIGTGPKGYRPPRRPTGPIHPRPLGGTGGRVKLTGLPVPVVPVDRRPVGEPVAIKGGGSSSGPVTIAGHTVEPLKPIAPRQGYDRGSSSFARDGNGASSGKSSQGYHPAPSHPVYTGMPGHSAPGLSQGANRSFPQSGSRPPSSTSGSHPSGGGGSSSHASAPSGGGGGGHASGGGGSSGGGGGTHK